MILSPQSRLVLPATATATATARADHVITAHAEPAPAHTSSAIERATRGAAIARLTAVIVLGTLCIVLCPVLCIRRA